MAEVSAARPVNPRDHAGIGAAAAGEPAIRLGAVAAAMTLGCVALLMLGVQPLVLGSLRDAHRLSIGEMGQAATLEMLVLGVVAGALGGGVPHRRLRLWGVAGCALLALANLAGLASSGPWLVASRGLSGAGAGIIVWIVTGLITRRADAVRLSAAFYAAQALTQAGLAAVVPAALAPRLGANGALAALFALAVLTAPLLLAIPPRLADLPKAGDGKGALSAAGGSGLAASFLAMAGIVGVWVFVEPLAAMAHVAAQAAESAIAASLGMQVLGALAVMWAGHRIPPGRALVGVCLAYLGSIAAFSGLGPAGVFFASALLFGFLWSFALPLFVQLLIEVDPTRRAAMLLPGAQLLGGSAGPMLTGMFATESSVRPVLVVGAALFALAAAAILLALASRTRVPAAVSLAG